MELRVCKTFLPKPCYRGDSLRSKSFQSTHCARVGTIAKKWKMGEGRGEDENPLPSPPTELLFLTPVPTFSKNASVKKLATLVTVIIQLSWSKKNVEDECTKHFLKTVFENKWSCY